MAGIALVIGLTLLIIAKQKQGMTFTSRTKLTPEIARKALLELLKRRVDNAPGMSPPLAKPLQDREALEELRKGKIEFVQSKCVIGGWVIDLETGEFHKSLIAPTLGGGKLRAEVHGEIYFEEDWKARIIGTVWPNTGLGGK